MALYLHLMIISFALPCFCSVEFLAISDHHWPPFSLFEESGSGEPTEPPSTSPPVTTTEVLNCQNGGTFNGTQCICRPEYSGKLCQDLDNFEPDKFNTSVEVNAELKVQYEEDFADKETPVYKEFAKNFTNKMISYYKIRLSNLEDVLVIAIREGNPLVRRRLTTIQEVLLDHKTVKNSVIVDHEVILTILNNGSAEEQLQNNVQALGQATNGLVNCEEECPYVAVAAPTVTGGELNTESVCKSDPQLGFSHQVVQEEGTFVCVTQCDHRHDESKECYNGGKCNIVLNVGPNCQCPETDSTWYLGDSCSSPIKTHAFYTGLSVTLVCLVVTVGALVAYVLLYKRRRNQKKDVKEKLVKEWLNEDFEWSRSNSAMNTPDTGVERNSASLPGPSNLYGTNPGDSRRSVPFYNLNRPSQMNIPSVSHASSASPYNNFSSNRQMRINRPQVKASWDD